MKKIILLFGISLLAASCSNNCGYQTILHSGVVKEKYFQPASAGGYAHDSIDWTFKYILTDGKIINSQTPYDIGESISWTTDEWVCPSPPKH